MNFCVDVDVRSGETDGGCNACDQNRKDLYISFDITEIR